MSDPRGRLKPILARLAEGGTLSRAEAEGAFDVLMSGEATPAQTGALLMALRLRGETVDEIAGAVSVMRAKALAIAAPPGAVDCCGTGGDGRGTLNVSTAASFVLAGAGVPVAKHGNRALSSRSGAADVLGALGVNIEADLRLVQRALDEAGVAFLMAPRHHSAMRHVGPARVELGMRTIFNLLGPLANPAGVRRQLVGVFSPQWLEPMAETLAALGSERAWLVHGAGGLDEVSTLGETQVVELRDGALTRFVVRPEEVGLPRATLDDITGGDAEENAAALRAVLDGRPGPYRDIVLMNAAAALIVAGRAEDLAEGLGIAARSLDGGAARTALDRLVAITNEPPPSDEEPEAGDSTTADPEPARQAAAR